MVCSRSGHLPRCYVGVPGGFILQRFAPCACPARILSCPVTSTLACQLPFHAGWHALSLPYAFRVQLHQVCAACTAFFSSPGTLWRRRAASATSYRVTPL